MSNYLTTDGLKKFSLLPEAPLRTEARGICHIWHMVNPALVVDILDVVTDTNFGDHRLRGFWVAGVKFPPLPLTFIVALTTLSHYRASV